jgi:hypothetical protein
MQHNNMNDQLVMTKTRKFFVDCLDYYFANLN